MTMHQLREYMKVIEGNHAKEEEVYEILWWGICKLKHHDEDDFNRMMMKVHCVVYGAHFDEHTAKKAVAKMHNVDGTTGEHWSYEETSRLADQHNIQCKADWYYALNMMYSDLYKIYGNDVNMYAKIANALYFDDPDMTEGKLFKAYIATH